jgi:hypothetical protein
MVGCTVSIRSATVSHRRLDVGRGAPTDGLRPHSRHDQLTSCTRGGGSLDYDLGACGAWLVLSRCVTGAGSRPPLRQIRAGRGWSRHSVRRRLPTARPRQQRWAYCCGHFGIRCPRPVATVLSGQRPWGAAFVPEGIRLGECRHGPSGLLVSPRGSRHAARDGRTPGCGCGVNLALGRCPDYQSALTVCEDEHASHDRCHRLMQLSPISVLSCMLSTCR